MKEFVLNNLDVILALILALISGTITIINVIRVKKSEKATADVKATALAREELMATINDLIIDAEKLKQYNGEEKKQYVMTRALQICSGVMSQDEIDNYIEEQVKHVSDNVNKNAKVRNLGGK